VTRRIRCPWPFDFEALHTAWRAATTAKRRRIDVAAFEVRLAERLEHLRCSLADGRWRPGPYRVFSVVERGKVRRVAAAPFADRIVHHAVVNALSPVWERRFMGWSCANRQGRGTHDAMRRAVAGARRCRFALSVDVARFFPSVDHEVLKGLVARHVAGGPLLNLVGRIIDSGRSVLRIGRTGPLLGPGPAERPAHPHGEAH
jgi:retron-type reverse transcriptase